MRLNGKLFKTASYLHIMNKVAVCVKDESRLPDMQKLLEKKGLKYVTRNPDFVISLGGDGTFLISERKFPGVPKLIIKDSKICNTCVGSNKETILDFMKMNAFEIKEEIKIEGSFKGHEFVAINDIIIRNKTPNQAIRFSIFVDGAKKHEEIIGDGLIVSTPFGSSAYFQSITRENFDEGLGMAFNNPVESHEPVYLKKNQVIKVKLLRGDAQITFDNERKIHVVKEGETIMIRKTFETAKIIKLEGFEDENTSS